MRQIRTIIILGFISLVLACDSPLAKVKNTPEENYDLFFEYMKKDYAYEDEHSFSIDFLYEKYLDQIKNTPTDEMLAQIITDVEAELLDPHFYPSQAIYDLSTNQRPDYGIQKPLSIRDHIAPVFNEVELLNEGEFFTYGTIKTDASIGYVYIHRLNAGLGGTNFGVNDWKQEIETIIEELLAKSVTRMIVDIRSSAGGSNFNAAYIANRFANNSKPYLIEIWEASQGAEGKSTFNVKPEGEHFFRDGKVALLTNNITCSGGEIFSLAMKQRTNLVHIGSQTKGCTGAIVTRDLLNGWNFLIPSSKTTTADGTNYFKTGFAPDILILNEATYGVSTFDDKVIERAIIELN